jgi:hypothetical protein
MAGIVEQPFQTGDEYALKKRGAFDGAMMA